MESQLQSIDQKVRDRGEPGQRRTRPRRGGDGPGTETASQRC